MYLIQSIRFGSWKHRRLNRVEDYDSPPGLCTGRQPITSVEFKFVARQVVASVVIWAAKVKFVVVSRPPVCFAQKSKWKFVETLIYVKERAWFTHDISLYFAARQFGHKRGNTRNKVFQLAMQQCCGTSWRKTLTVLPDLNLTQYIQAYVFIHAHDTDSLECIIVKEIKQIRWDGKISFHVKYSCWSIAGD